ncbi:MAG: rhodanese-like domain-containing protein [Ardenticatenia bacterium]|nr:rhodanese-like domain-containing protein [Ardenticatenia bacterium]
MLLRYFYDPRLAHASYLVGCQSTGEAIVIDPGRDVEPYLDVAEAEELSIVAAFETHIHADFLSGARELAERVGAHLYLSDEGDENWKYTYAPNYDHTLLEDGDTFTIGRIVFEVLHTPGHTPEHISLLLTDTAAADTPMGIFTGDFVFVGSIGRPDLLEKAAGISGTAEEGARQMFRSLKRFKQLPDYLQVWPAHGAGSACGKGLGAIPSSTVGYEKLFNPGLRFDDKDAFVRWLLADQPEPPRYFAVMKRLNKEERPVLHTLPRPEHLPVDRLESVLADGALVVDTRPVTSFAVAHIPGTINIPFDSSFTTWAGWFLPYDRDFYLIADDERVPDIVRALISIGLDRVAGYFRSTVVEQWLNIGNPVQKYDVVLPQEIADQIMNGDVFLVDVRNEAERHEDGAIPGSFHIMLGYLPERVAELPKEKPIVVQCRTGHRSAIAASILQAHGVGRVINMLGGIRDWKRAGLPVENGH